MTELAPGFLQFRRPASIPRQSPPGPSRDAALGGPADPPRAPGPSLLFPALAVALGLVVVAAAYRLQFDGGHATSGALLFWAGLLLAVLPAAARLMSRRAGLFERVYALLLIGGATAAPRILRAGGPLFTDEFAAWRQTVDAVTGTSPLVRAGFVPGVEGEPGLHLLVGSVSSLSGLSVWTAAVVVLTAAHLVGALAVFAVASALLDRPRPAGVAALVYLLNPLSLWSGTRLAPDSLAIPLVLAALALTVRACRVEQAGTRRALGVAAGALLAFVALTDSTVTLMTVALLAVVLVAALWRTRQHPMQVTVLADGSVGRRLVGMPEYPGLWGGVLAVQGLALLLVAGVLAATGGAFEQAADWFPSRGLAGMPGSPPLFEVVLTVLAPLVVFALSAEGVWRLWSHPRRRSGRLLALASVGLLYFPLVPLALLPTIAPGVRSAWGLTYLGVALLCAPILLQRFDALQARDRWVVERVSAGPLVSLALAVVLLGNSAASAGAGYRYAGPARYGAEGRTDIVELRSIATAFAADHGRVGILADRYTGPGFAAFSGSRLPRATTLLPGNELMQGVDPDVGWVSGLVRRGYSYLVVDVRMAGTTPLDGDSFGPDDPGEGRQPRMAALRRLDRVPWVSRVASSEHYRVYRIDLAAAGRPLVEQADAWGEDYGPLPGTPEAALPPDVAATLPASASYGPVVPGPAPAGAPAVGAPQIFPADGSPPRPAPGAAGGLVIAGGRAALTSVSGGGAGAAGPGGPDGAGRSVKPGKPTVPAGHGGKPKPKPGHGKPAGPAKPPKSGPSKPGKSGPSKPGKSGPSKPGKPAKSPKAEKPAKPPKGGHPAKPPKGGKPAKPPKAEKPAKAEKPPKPAKAAPKPKPAPKAKAAPKAKEGPKGRSAPKEKAAPKAKPAKAEKGPKPAKAEKPPKPAKAEKPPKPAKAEKPTEACQGGEAAEARQGCSEGQGGAQGKVGAQGKAGQEGQARAEGEGCPCQGQRPEAGQGQRPEAGEGQRRTAAQVAGPSTREARARRPRDAHDGQVRRRPGPEARRRRQARPQGQGEPR